MRRREFVTLLGGAVAWPLATRAEQPAGMRHIGLLMGLAKDEESSRRLAAFRLGLRELGWKENENVQIEERWGVADMGLIRRYAAELVDLRPDVIVVEAARTAPVVQQATRTIPIVFVGLSDPIAQGLVESLAHPGGNITGFTLFEWSIMGKLLEALKQFAPGITHVAAPFNPDNPSAALHGRAFEAAAATLAIQPIKAPVHDGAEIERVIETLAGEPNSGLLLLPDLTTIIHRDLIIRLAAKYRLPAIYSYKIFASDGGLMSYGVDIVELFRRSASYVNRILRGEKPGDLPVQQPVKFELVINLKTAKALGLEISPMLLARADEVIE
jgi:putative ABC transport system substrate-binding protein